MRTVDGVNCWLVYAARWHQALNNSAASSLSINGMYYVYSYFILSWLGARTCARLCVGTLITLRYEFHTVSLELIWMLTNAVDQLQFANKWSVSQFKWLQKMWFRDSDMPPSHSTRITDMIWCAALNSMFFADSCCDKIFISLWWHWT